MEIKTNNVVRRSKIRSAVKIHGGKFYLSPWIISNFPENYEKMAYVEPFSGGASVLLNKNKSTEEVINDIDYGLVNMFRYIRDEPEAFIKKIKKIEYSEKSFTKALSCKITDGINAGVNEYVLRRMSRGGLKKTFAWSDRQRGGKPGDVNAWDTMVDLLPKISQRLQGVCIFGRKALQVIDAYNERNTLLYCDPPYLHSTRYSKSAYSHEMSTEDHEKLGVKLKYFRGKAIVSGYRSDLYDHLYSNWRREEHRISNHASQKREKEKKTECIWLNF